MFTCCNYWVITVLKVGEIVSEQHLKQTEATTEKAGWMGKLKRGLAKTGQGLNTFLLGKKEIDDELLEDIETQLLLADVGVDAVTQVMGSITQLLARDALEDADALVATLRAELKTILAPCEQVLDVSTSKPFVMLVVGVNGAGKTTTIGKMAHKFQRDGKSVMLAAGDTFRAAAVEQLQVWGERNNVPVVAQHTGADSASVIYDAVSAAKSRNADLLIADTAGRLHNKDHLMAELEKVIRVMKKVDDAAPHEVLLVLDAGAGQNAISQAEAFAKSVNVTGLAITKLDGTAKGGVVVAIAKRLGLPIRFIGVGEGMEDLRPFNASDFVDALFQLDV